MRATQEALAQPLDGASYAAYGDELAPRLADRRGVVFSHHKVTVQRLVELFVEAVTRALAWVDEHRAYLFLMAAGVVALNMALNLWGLIELEKLARFATGAPLVAGLADAGGRAAERFRSLAERYEGWKDEKVINEIINAPLKGERLYEAFLRVAKSANLPEPLVELRKALMNVKDEVVKEVAALVLYKALVNNAGAWERAGEDRETSIAYRRELKEGILSYY